MANALQKIACLLLLYFLSPTVYGQYEIKPEPGYSTQIGIMVDMLEDLKDRINEQVRELDQEQTDFLFDEQANRIGAIILHLVATESYYQVETLEERTWTEEEAARWGMAAELGPEARETLQGKPIQYYLDLWDEVRAKSLLGLKMKDDAWFASEVDEGINNHWVWFHVMEHQAHHLGQISLILKRLPE